MSYVGDPFHHDVFVSYSHGDVDGTGSSKLKQWSQGFVRELESELKALPKLGPKVSVFLDQHLRPAQGLDPMASLTDQLRGEISASAILAVLMSPHYLASSWCQEERECWAAAQGSSGVAPDNRIAVARIWPTADAPQPWPPELADGEGEPLVGFTFFDRARADLRPQPYEWPEPGADSRGPFRDELLSMVGYLKLHLDALKAELDAKREQEANAERLSLAEGQVVYLHGREDQADAWGDLRESLSDQGLVVVPSEPDPVEADPQAQRSIRNQRVSTLSACDALLLVGSGDSRSMDSDLIVVGRQDRIDAKALSDRLLPCALLDTQGEALASVREIARRLKVDWIDATQQDWSGDLRRWMRQAGQALAGAR